MSLLCSTFRFSKLHLVNLRINNYATSALYITGDKAKDTFAVLTPHLDFDERLKNKEELKNNIKRRNLNINLEDLIRLWNFYKHVESKKNNLEHSKISISQTIKNLSLKKGDKYAEKINTLKAHGKMVKEDLKILNDELWAVEEKAALNVLSLPNYLHNNTPESEFSILHTFKQKPENLSNSHIGKGKDLDLIEYIDPYNYYLKNDAALFEFSLTCYLNDKLLEKNYLAFSNPNFSRSVVLEGCGLDFSDLSRYLTVIEDKNEKVFANCRLHLTGSASLTGFMAYFCKHTIFPTLLPFKYFSVGKKYQSNSLGDESLFNVTQETAAHIFVATTDFEEQIDKEFNNVLKDYINVYESLGYHFRVGYVPARDLQLWESLRASFQLYSPHLKHYIEVGNISICGNYISKRLLFSYGTGNDIKYPCIITGTLLSVPKLLSCILESDNYTNKCLLPDVLQKC